MSNLKWGGDCSGCPERPWEYIYIRSFCWSAFEISIIENYLTGLFVLLQNSHSKSLYPTAKYIDKPHVKVTQK